jgi:hypothetical protein
VGFAGFATICGSGVLVGFATAVPASGPATAATGSANVIARAIQREVRPSVMAELPETSANPIICVE